MEIQRKIIESYNPPSNKEVWWFDRNEEVLKRHKNGAWISVNDASDEASNTPIEMSIYEIDNLAKEGKLIPGQVYCEPSYYARWNCQMSVPSAEDSVVIFTTFESSKAYPLYLTAATPYTFYLNAKWGSYDCSFDIKQSSYQYNLIIGETTYHYKEKLTKKEAIKYGINFNQEIDSMDINQAIGDEDPIYLFDNYAIVGFYFEGENYIYRYNFDDNNWEFRDYDYTITDIQDTLPNKGKLYDLRSSDEYYRMAVSGTYKWEVQESQSIASCSGTAFLQSGGGCSIKVDPLAGHCLLPIRMVGDESQNAAVRLSNITVEENSTVFIPYDGTKSYGTMYTNSHVGNNCSVVLLSESQYNNNTILISIGVNGMAGDSSHEFTFYSQIPTSGNMWTPLGSNIELCSSIFCTTVIDVNSDPSAIMWLDESDYFVKITANKNAIIGKIFVPDDETNTLYEVEVNVNTLKQDSDNNYLIPGFDTDSPLGSDTRVAMLTVE